MTTANPPPEDLMVLARRGEASLSERRRLDMYLGASRFERWLHALGCEYDRMPTECDGDDALLARVVRKAADHLERGRRRGRRRLAVAVGAVACFATLGAAAVTLPRMLASNSPPTEQQCAECPGTEQMQTAGPRGQVRVSAEPAPQLREKSAVAPISPTDPFEPAPRGADQQRLVSAAEQFAAANALRRSGRGQAAIAAYRRLQRQHPASSEARLSHVLLGRILLQQGAGGTAYQQFSSYLRSSPGGSLAEEAMNGQAMALRMSGRTAEEHEVYRRLIERFPNSVYAETARERLRGSD